MKYMPWVKNVLFVAALGSLAGVAFAVSNIDLKSICASLKGEYQETGDSKNCAVKDMSFSWSLF